VYILHHLIERKLKGRGGRLYALFLDLKAAFDNINRKKLWEYLQKIKITDHLVERIKEMYAETVNRVKVNGNESDLFWTEKGVRQGCPLSPTLFATYISDLDKVLKEAQAGGIVVGREKVWSLAYADDLVLVAKDETGMRE